MRLETITAGLANLHHDATRVELNEWALGTLRDMFPGRTEVGELLTLEAPRVRACGGLPAYCRARRPGCRVRLNRSARVALFVLVRTRDAA